MIATESLQDANLDTSNLESSAETLKFRKAAQGDAPQILTDIYEEKNNIAIWQRELSAPLKNTVAEFLVANPKFQASVTVTPESALNSIRETLGEAGNALSEDIAELVDMFCCLFELKRTGVRLTALDSAMCPRFHVDRVPCRLVTTYQGSATEWLPHQRVNRTKLGHGSQGKTDSESGLYQDQSDIQQLNNGDIALLKGELWEGNENAGLVHRSPELSEGERRLLLTMDFSH